MDDVTAEQDGFHARLVAFLQAPENVAVDAAAQLALAAHVVGSLVALQDARGMDVTGALLIVDVNMKMGHAQMQTQLLTERGVLQ
jgi:hypothetical protein